MIVQLILLVDFAHSWNESWVTKLEDGHTCYKWGASREKSMTLLFEVAGVFCTREKSMAFCLK